MSPSLIAGDGVDPLGDLYQWRTLYVGPYVFWSLVSASTRARISCDNLQYSPPCALVNLKVGKRCSRSGKELEMSEVDSWMNLAMRSAKWESQCTD